jgi:hypothetical protein
MIKALKKSEKEGTYHNIIYYNIVYIANIILNEENLKPFPLKVRNETRVSTLSTHIQYKARIHSQSNKSSERNKRDTNRKEVTLFQFEDYVIIYLKDPKDSIKKKNLRSDKHFQQSSRI